jgi:hypothetical protein
MAAFSRVTPRGWSQGDDAAAYSRVTPRGWEQEGSGGPPPEPISFAGTIPTITFTVGTAGSVDLSSYFSGTLTPFTFALDGASASLPSGVSLSSAALLSWTGSGTPGTTSGVIVQGTDTGTNADDSNAFSVVIQAAGVPVIGTLVPGETSVLVPWTGTATEYRIDGGTAAPLPDGTSPDTITGLSAATEYNSPGLQLRNTSGGDWSTAAPFGTLNPGEGGGGVETPTIIDGTVGAAAASGLTAAIGLRTGIEVNVGLAQASGQPVGIALGLVIAGGVGEAAASGLGAAISLGSNVTIAAGVGLGSALGLGAQILASTNIAAAVGAAAAAGLPASITVGSGATVAGGVGEAAASGLAATITFPGPVTISCAVGSAEALGLRAIIRTLGALPGYADQPTTSSSWSYKQTGTLWSLVSRDEWGGQTVHSEPALFLCDFSEDSKRAVTAAGDEFTTRLLVYTSLPGVKQGDMLLIGATAERDPYMAGAHEVRAVTRFGDTFTAEGPPDFRIAT